MTKLQKILNNIFVKVLFFVVIVSDIVYLKLHNINTATQAFITLIVIPSVLYIASLIATTKPKRSFEA